MIADIADGKELAQEIAAEHGANSVASAITDVSDETSVKALVAAAIERFGKIDVLVNNAALFAPLQETKCTEIDGELWGASPGPSGGARFPVVGGERFRHRPDARGRWRQREYLIFGASNGR